MKPTASQYAYAFLELSRGSDSSEQAVVVGRFLAFLKCQRETKKLPAILRNLQQLVDQSEGVRRVQMTTNEVLNESALEDFTQKIKKLLDSEKLIVEQKVDKRMIGGVTFRTETELFDGTVRRRLEELRKVLAE